MNLLLAAIVLALAACCGSILYAVRVLVSSRIDQSLTQSLPDKEGFNEQLYAEVIKRVEDLTIAVDEGIRRVDRAENRVQKTVTSARRLVSDAGLEHAGIDAEHEELQSSNGEGIEPLPAMPVEVEAVRTVRVAGGTLQIG